MSENTGTGIKAYDYAKFPREFISYRWFKPLLVLLLATIFYFVMTTILYLIAGAWAGDVNFFDGIGESYDDTTVYTGPGALLEVGSLALLLPALALAALVVRDRPFSSYSSSRGGWNWKTFFKCMLVAVLVMALDFGFWYVVDPQVFTNGPVLFTTPGLILCILLVPLQSIAEEYAFRGFIVQTFGGWTKLPILAIIISAVIFAAGHPYNMIGVIAIFCNGIIWGFIAWKSKGLEATSALHVVNNMLVFLMAGAGLMASTSDVEITSLVDSIAIDIAFAAIVLIWGKKRGWFEPTKDGAAEFNAKRRAVYERKLAAKQGSQPVAPEQAVAGQAVAGQAVAGQAVAGQPVAPEQAVANQVVAPEQPVAPRQASTPGRSTSRGKHARP